MYRQLIFFEKVVSGVVVLYCAALCVVFIVHPRHMQNTYTTWVDARWGAHWEPLWHYSQGAEFWASGDGEFPSYLADPHHY